MMALAEQSAIYFPTAVRVTDPVSSHVAHDEHTASGRRARHAEDVFAVVESRPGLTYREVASYINWLEPVEVMRRLSDLAEQGRAERGEQRTCSISGRRSLTWWPR